MTKERGLLFLFNDRAYGFNVEVKHYKFFEDYDFLCFWVFEILVWESYRCIFLELKKKKKKI